jgi:hypothetical protein
MLFGLEDIAVQMSVWYKPARKAVSLSMVSLQMVASLILIKVINKLLNLLK